MAKVSEKKDSFRNYSSDEDEDEPQDYRNSCSLSNSDNLSSFLHESSIHGIKYVGQSDQCLGARIFWIAMFLFGVGASIYWVRTGVVADLLENPVIISFQESEITIDQIPFPAVTICSSSKRKAAEFLKQYKYFLSYKNSTTLKSPHELEDFYRRYNSIVYLLDLCQDSNGFSDHFQAQKAIKNIGKEIEDNKELEFVMKYARRALHNCEDIVLLCLWASQPFDCATEWTSIITEYGNCCSFNMIPEFVLRKNYPHHTRQNQSFGNSSKWRRRYEAKLQAWSGWSIDKHLVEKEEKARVGNKSGSPDVPKHQRNAGMSSGLSIVINPDFDGNGDSVYNGLNYHCNSLDGFGFRVHVHSPIEYPHISDFGKAVRSNTETFMDIKAAITMPDPEVVDFSKENRQCYFNGERNLSSFKDYTQKNCVDECVMDQVYKMCNCVRIYMPRQSQHLCMTQSESNCLRNATNSIMENGTMNLCSHCWPACTQLEYFAATTELPLRDDIGIWKRSKAGNGKANDTKKIPKDVAIVHLYFSKEKVESRARKSLYSAIQILASAGGVIGLTLGISMISFVEPIYFLTLRRLFGRNTSIPTEKTLQNEISQISPTQIFVQPLHTKMKDGQQFVVEGIPRAWIQN